MGLKAVITKTVLSGIADAIRAKSGKADQMTPEQMAVEIQALETGGVNIVPFIERTAREVNVGPAKTIADYEFYKHDLVEAVIASECEAVGMYAFDSCPNLLKITMPNLVRVENYAFRYCGSGGEFEFYAPKLETICDNAFGTSKYGSPTNYFTKFTDFPSTEFPAIIYIGAGVFKGSAALKRIVCESLETINGDAFRECVNLATVELPNLSRIGNAAFYKCTSLVELTFPKAEAISNASFYGCSALKKFIAPILDGYSSEGGISGNAFALCNELRYVETYGTNWMTSGNNLSIPSLEAFVLRSVSVESMSSSYTTVFAAQGPIITGSGYVYVSRSLIESYKTTTNWAALYAANPNVFRAIEDYSVDGTATGDMDLEKMGVDLNA